MNGTGWRGIFFAFVIGSALAAQSGPRNTMSAGRREFAYQGRVYAWDPKAGGFVPREDLPPLVTAMSPGVRDLAWDGTWAYMLLEGAGGLELQHGLALATPDGPAWFWRPGPRLPPHSELIVVAGRRALLRQEVPAAEGIPREQGRLVLLLLDLVDGSRTEVDAEAGWPERLTVAGCVLDGDMLVFWGTGRVIRLTPEGRTAKVETPNFWTDLGIDLSPNLREFMGKKYFQAPTNCRKPFLLEDGRVGAAFRATQKVPEALVETYVTKFYIAVDEKLKFRMIEQQVFPVTEASKRRATVEVLLFMAWDPTARKMRLLERSTWEDLVQDPEFPHSQKIKEIEGHHELKGNPAAFQMASDGRIRPLETLLQAPRRDGPGHEGGAPKGKSTKNIVNEIN